MTASERLTWALLRDVSLYHDLDALGGADCRARLKHVKSRVLMILELQQSEKQADAAKDGLKS